MKRLLRSWLWRVPVGQEVDEEIAFHLEMRARDLVARGLDPDEARAEAARRLGDVDHLKRTCFDIGTRRDREMRLTQSIEDASMDVRFALRQLGRSPLFTFVATLTLALGIGVNGAMFSLADAVFVRPLPFPDPQRLVMLTEVPPGSGRGERVAPRNFADWNIQSHAFEAMAAVIAGGGRTAIGADGMAERIPAQVVTARYFDVLGTRPLAGRTFAAGDAVPGSNLVVMSERLWRSRHGASPEVVGRSIRLDDQVLTVIGIVPDQVPMLGPVDLWTLLNPADDRRSRYLQVIGRLDSGETLESARAEMEQIAAGIARVSPATNDGWAVGVEPLRDALIGGEVRHTSLLLVGVVGLVLLMACANVASLLLARTTARGREIAVRTAIGAGRRRIAAQFLVESAVLAGFGGALGLGIGAVILRAITAVIPEGLLPAPVALTFDPRVALFCTAAAGLVALFVGLGSVWQATRIPPVEAMAGHGRVTKGATRLRSLLVAAEVAAAVVLLCGAGLLTRTLVALDGVAPGYRASGVLATDVFLPRNRYPTEEHRRRFYELVEREVSVLPGVRRAGWGSMLPLGGRYYGQSFEIVGEPAEDQRHPPAAYHMVSPSYFDVLGIPVLSGRSFTDRDIATSVQVAIVNEAFVRRYLPGRETVGLRIRIPPMSFVQEPPVVREIVGVVGVVKELPDEGDDPVQVYVPIAQNAWTTASMVVAPAIVDGTVLTSAVRAAVARIDSTLPLSGMRTLEDIAGDSTSRPRFRAVLVGAFAALALGLATVGVFGVVAYSVQQRTREFAVRRALGANDAGVLGMVLGSAVRIGASGAVAGLVLAALLTRLLEGLLFGVEPLDTATFAVVSGAIVLTVVASAALPAIRASRIDPAAVLRTE